MIARQLTYEPPAYQPSPTALVRFGQHSEAIWKRWMDLGLVEQDLELAGTAPTEIPTLRKWLDKATDPWPAFADVTAQLRVRVEQAEGLRSKIDGGTDNLRSPSSMRSKNWRTETTVRSSNCTSSVT